MNNIHELKPEKQRRRVADLELKQRIAAHLAAVPIEHAAGDMLREFLLLRELREGSRELLRLSAAGRFDLLAALARLEDEDLHGIVALGMVERRRLGEQRAHAG